MYPDKPQMSLTEGEKSAGNRNKEVSRANSDMAKSISDMRIGNKRTKKIKAFDGKVDENSREVNSANAIDRNVSVKSLRNLAGMGFPTELSGDAIARARKGQTPKLHRS